MAIAKHLRTQGIECEFADPETIVFMITPQTSAEDLTRLVRALGKCTGTHRPRPALPLPKGAVKCSIRKAIFAPHESVAVKDALGRICGSPTVSCPPAIPVVVSGEIITPEAVRLFQHYGIQTVDVVREE